MIPSKYRFSLDIHEAQSCLCLDVKRSDSNSRTLFITLTEDGFPYRISDECYAVFAATKPDGNIVRNPCVIEDNTIIYKLTPQTTAAVGIAACEIKLYGADDALITSPGFLIHVNQTEYGEGDQVESETEVTALTHLISEAAVAVAESKQTNEESKALIAELEADREELGQNIMQTKQYADSAQESALAAEEEKAAAGRHMKSARSAADIALEAKQSAEASAAAAAGYEIDSRQASYEAAVSAEEAKNAAEEAKRAADSAGNAPSGGGAIDGDLDMNQNSIMSLGSLEFWNEDDLATVVMQAAFPEGSNEDEDFNGVLELYTSRGDEPVVIRNVAKAKSPNEAVNKQQLDEALALVGSPLIGTTAEITPTEVIESIESGRNILLLHADKTMGVFAFNSFVVAEEFDTIYSTNVVNLGATTMLVGLYGTISADNWTFNTKKILNENDAVKNPYALTIGNAVYDGSDPVSIPAGYSKLEIDAIMGAYINDIDALVGGDS